LSNPSRSVRCSVQTIRATRRTPLRTCCICGADGAYGRASEGGVVNAGAHAHALSVHSHASRVLRRRARCA
jgi:hypothetical protein